MSQAIIKIHGEPHFRRITMREALELEKAGKAYRPSSHQPGVFYGTADMAAKPAAPAPEVAAETVAAPEPEPEPAAEPAEASPAPAPEQAYDTRALKARSGTTRRRTPRKTT
jgi:hypothetical protein